MEEWWFWLVIGSAVFTGFQTFTYKVAAERDYDVALLNVYGGFVSGFLLLILALIYAENYYLSAYVLSLSALTALLYLIGNVARHHALQAVDTAIFFPLYKVLGPSLVIFAGILLFGESFSKTEWIGLILSLLVPVLLISRVEKIRQTNLRKGLQLLCVTTIFTVLAALTTKEMAVATNNIWFLVAVGDMLMAVMAVILFWRQSGDKNVLARAISHTSRSLITTALWLGVLQGFAYVMVIFAYQTSPVGIVYTIHSLYILIPIILSIIYYHEHWNVRKVAAIVLSIAALWFLQ